MPSNDQKAYLESESGDKVPCLFNPEQLSITVTANWDGEAKAGLQAPTLSYQGGASGSLSVELFLDTTNTGKPVTDHTDKLIKLTKIDTSLPGYDEQQKNGRPPWVKFHWGKFHSFKGVVNSLSLTYELFSAEGEPLRARADLTITQYEPEDDWPKQNPTSGTPAPARSHQIQPGETLDRISARYYDSPTQWRRLAAANGIKDPFTIRTGSRIDVPTLEN